MHSIAKPPFAFVSNTLCIVSIYAVHPQFRKKNLRERKIKKKKEQTIHEYIAPAAYGNWKFQTFFPKNYERHDTRFQLMRTPISMRE